MKFTEKVTEGEEVSRGGSEQTMHNVENRGGEQACGSLFRLICNPRRVDLSDIYFYLLNQQKLLTAMKN